MDKGPEDHPPDGDVQQTQAHDGESHHGTAAESDLQAAVERTHRRIGRPGRCIRRRPHAHIAGQSGEETARQEGERDPGVLHPESIGQDGEQAGQHRENDDDHLVLLLEISHGTFAHIPGDFLHHRSALALLHHLREEDPGKEERHHRSGRDQIKQRIHSRLV